MFMKKDGTILFLKYSLFSSSVKFPQRNSVLSTNKYYFSTNIFFNDHLSADSHFKNETMNSTSC